MLHIDSDVAVTLEHDRPGMLSQSITVAVPST